MAVKMGIVAHRSLRDRPMQSPREDEEVGQKSAEPTVPQNREAGLIGGCFFKKVDL